MLAYEKKLHLDEHWQKMQSCGAGKKCVWILLNIVCFTVLYIGLKWALTYIPDLSPWDTSAVVAAFGTVSLTSADIIYFSIGLLANLYGSIRYYGINQQNHNVRKNSDTPDALLTTGYYSKVRHPMYGVFVLRFAAVALSLRSVIGMGLTIVFAASQYVNARREEKHVLIPLFQDSYQDYSNHVRRLLLKPGEMIVLILFLLMSLVGLFVS